MCILAVVAKFDDPPLSKAREQLCRGNAAGLFSVSCAAAVFL